MTDRYQFIRDMIEKSKTLKIEVEPADWLHTVYKDRENGENLEPTYLLGGSSVKHSANKGRRPRDYR